MYSHKKPDQIIQYLEIMLNDVTATSLFRKGPLSWFKIYRTIENINKKEDISEKQISLIEGVFRQYLFHKKVSKLLVKDGLDRKVIKAISNFLNALPKSANKSEKGKRSYLGTIRSRLSNGDLLTLKTLENIERVAVEINPELANVLLKDIQEVRLKYFQAYNACKMGKMETIEEKEVDQIQIKYGEIPHPELQLHDISGINKIADEKKIKGSLGNSKIPDKESLPYYLSQGLERVKDHQYKHAIDDFTRAISANENDSSAWFNRGLTYLLLGDEKMGMTDIDIAAKLGNDEAKRWLSSKENP